MLKNSNEGAPAAALLPFTTGHRFNGVFRWLGLNANGDCSILVALPAGAAVYVHCHHVQLFRSVYGPVKAHGNTGVPEREAVC